MSTWLVSIAVTSDDDDLAQRVAAFVADLTEDMAALGDGDCHTFIADPVKVTP